MPIFRKKAILDKEQAATVVAAIRDAEKETSGEIRVYMETKNKYVDPMLRAKEVFDELNMDHTQLRNGVLIYIATQHKEVCILGDEGIYKALSVDIWQDAIRILQSAFARQEYVAGLTNTITYIGQLLHNAFPYDGVTDKNELPDNIVFGK